MNEQKLLRCARALVDGIERRDFCCAVIDGRIAATGDRLEMERRFPSAARHDFGDDLIVVPGLINGHSHAYQILLRGWADDLPFERWRSEALYRIVPSLTPEQIYEVFVLAFDEMLAAGITTVTEFFYLNGAGNGHAEAAIAAAERTGIRLIFARTWMDAPYAPAAFRETIDEARARTSALIGRYPDVDVCVAPHSLHAASPEMILAAAEFARDTDRMMHIHVAEAAYEVTQTLERSGATPIELLSKLGALNERTVAVHAIYVTPEERRMIADAGARVIHNPVTNQYLGDGICDVVEFLRLGVPVGLGTDADVKPSVLDEMRAAALLQKIRRCDGAALCAASAWALGTVQGARALRIEAGELREGSFADFVAIDATRIDSWSPAVNALVYRAESSWVRETYVAGLRRFPSSRQRQLPDWLEPLLADLRLPQELK